MTAITAIRFSTLFYIRPDGEAGEKTAGKVPEDLLRKADNGIYVTELTGLHAGASAVFHTFLLLPFTISASHSSPAMARFRISIEGEPNVPLTKSRSFPRRRPVISRQRNEEEL